MNNEPSNKNGVTECVLVSYDNSNGKEHSVLIVGKKRKNESVEIINAFQNEEADELWKKLTIKKKAEQTEGME